MKKLLCLVAIVFILGTAAYSEASYALFAKKRAEIEARLKTLELQKENIESKSVKDKAIKEEIRRLDEEMLRLQEELKKLNDIQDIQNAKPKFNGIG